MNKQEIIEKMQTRIFEHQKENGFETIFDLLNEDLLELIDANRQPAPTDDIDGDRCLKCNFIWTHEDDACPECGSTDTVDCKITQPQPTVTDEEIKRIAVQFFRWWWNQGGTNTEQGFNTWWKENKSKWLRDSRPSEREITYEEKFDLLVGYYNWFADNPYHSLQDGVEDIISKYLNKKEDNNETGNRIKS